MGKVEESSRTRQSAGTVAAKVHGEGCPNAVKLDPRVRRTRKLLEDSMRSLLQEREYDAISVGDIADRATVNRATFYAHFEDKRDLAAKMLRGDLEATLLESLSCRRSMSAESLHTVAVVFFEFMARTLGSCPKRADDFALSVGPTVQEALQHFLLTWLEHDPEAARVFPGARRDAVATVLSWSLYGAAFRWTHLPRRPPAEQSAREIIALLVR